MTKYANFQKALSNLGEIQKYDEPYNIVELTGLVGLFELCFELSWRLMKYILEEEGVVEAETGSPRQILKLAFSHGLITDEDLWLDALTARNNATHSYNEKIAIDIINEAKTVYLNLFEQLDELVRQKYGDLL